MSAVAIATTAAPIIEARDLVKTFPVTRSTILRTVVGHVRAVDSVSFEIRRGETYSLVGESGCGKTTVARMILDIVRPTSGRISFDGVSVDRLRGPDHRRYRASVQAVFQDPWSSLDPRMRIGATILEPVQAHQRLSRGEARDILASLLLDVGLQPSHAERFPHEFSGGQRQRIAIARALSVRPSLIVLDEPISSLDVSIRAQIMNLLRALQAKYAVSYLLIAHDLSAVRYMSHRVGVMYLGRIVEQGPTRELFTRPLHPYTRALIGVSLPTRPNVKREPPVVRGEIPSPLDPPSGCTFHPRCPIAVPECAERIPELRTLGPAQLVACHLAHTGSE